MLLDAGLLGCFIHSRPNNLFGNGHISPLVVHHAWKQVGLGLHPAPVTVPELENVRLKLRALVKFIEKKRRRPVYTNFEDQLRSVGAVALPIGSTGVDTDRLRDKALVFLRDRSPQTISPSLKRCSWMPALPSRSN